MTGITVTSTTDTSEAVIAAQGDKAPEVKVETAAAPETTPEKIEASEASTDTETESEESEETLGADKPPKKGGLQKRVGKLTRQREDARREAEYWRAEALKNQKPQAVDKPLEVAPAKVTDGKPAPEGFTTHDEYVEALADWKVDQKLSVRDQKSREMELKAQQDSKLKTYLQTRDEFAKGHEDYFDRMADIDKIPMSITVNEVLLESKNGPELLYELAKDPEEYKRICSLSVVAAAREIGKVEARLAKASDQTIAAKQTTKAPKPIAPVGTGSTSTSTKALDEMDFEEYKKAREAGRTA